MNPLCIISGGTSGIGFGIAEKVAGSYRLALIYKSQHERANAALVALSKIAPDMQKVFCGDLAKPEEAERIHSEISAWDSRPAELLINCAGGNKSSFFATDPLPHQLHVVQQNLFTCMNLTHFVLKKMYSARKGHIVNISSLCVESPFLGTTSYAAAKSGVEAFTENLAREVRRAGIRVNCVRPGLVRTPMTESHIAQNPRLQSMLVSLSAVTSAVDYLLSPGNESVSGAIVPVINAEIR